MNGARSWLQVCGDEDADLAGRLTELVQKKIAGGEFSVDEMRRVQQLDMSPVREDLNVPVETLEKLRRLCQLWDVDLRARRISSHRRILGPVIVALKKLAYPVLRVFLRDFIRQQRDFNAACISLLAELAARQTGDKEPQG